MPPALREIIEDYKTLSELERPNKIDCDQAILQGCIDRQKKRLKEEKKNAARQKIARKKLDNYQNTIDKLKSTPPPDFVKEKDAAEKFVLRRASQLFSIMRSMKLMLAKEILKSVKENPELFNALKYTKNNPFPIETMTTPHTAAPRRIMQ